MSYHGGWDCDSGSDCMEAFDEASFRRNERKAREAVAQAPILEKNYLELSDPEPEERGASAYVPYQLERNLFPQIPLFWEQEKSGEVG